jgi:hypothetical protein
LCTGGKNSEQDPGAIDNGATEVTLTMTMEHLIGEYLIMTMTMNPFKRGEEITESS